MVGKKYPKMGNNPQLTNIIWFAEMQRTGSFWQGRGEKGLPRRYGGHGVTRRKEHIE